MRVDFSKFKISDLGAFTLMRIPTFGFAELVTTDVTPGIGCRNLRFATHEDAKACAEHLATLEKAKARVSIDSIAYAVVPWPTVAIVAYDEPKIREVKPLVEEAA